MRRQAQSPRRDFVLPLLPFPRRIGPVEIVLLGTTPPRFNTHSRRCASRPLPFLTPVFSASLLVYLSRSLLFLRTKDPCPPSFSAAPPLFRPLNSTPASRTKPPIAIRPVPLLPVPQCHVFLSRAPSMSLNFEISSRSSPLSMSTVQVSPLLGFSPPRFPCTGALPPFSLSFTHVFLFSKPVPPFPCPPRRQGTMWAIFFSEFPYGPPPRHSFFPVPSGRTF